MLTVQTVGIVTWAAQYNTWFLIALTLKGIVFSFSCFLQYTLKPSCVWSGWGWATSFSWRVQRRKAEHRPSRFMGPLSCCLLVSPLYLLCLLMSSQKMFEQVLEDAAVLRAQEPCLSFLHCLDPWCFSLLGPKLPFLALHGWPCCRIARQSCNLQSL